MAAEDDEWSRNCPDIVHANPVDLPHESLDPDTFGDNKIKS